ncbi:MAG: mandelate racemase [Armatimonadetes bacterium RBG_19FT_COMBO_69_19]|nr:MAG: mandelate racemase [Armatimonadetes bacterium RBG_19FT_COMBO_69_19]
MKITNVEGFIVQVPIRRAIEDSIHHVPTWGVPGALIRTDEGLTGTGYTGTHARGDDLIKGAIEKHLGPVLVGRDPFHVKQIWQDLYMGPLRWVGRAGISQMAQAAIDIALWDIIAQAQEQPLWRVLGAAKTGPVPTYNTDAGWLNWTEAELIDDIRRLIDQGWRAVKMKVGKPSLQEDVRRVAAVRAAIGDEVDLMVDANTIWDINTAISAARLLEPYRLTWLEEPLHPDDIGGHARLAEATTIPIAVGESIYSKYLFREYMARGAVGYVQVDATRVGGITEWLEVAATAATFGLPVVPHHGDMMQVHQHLVAATRNAPMLEYIPWILDLFEDPVDVREGVLHLPKRPGASTRMRKDAFERYRVA